MAGFITSVLGAAVEPFGVAPDADMVAWRDRNPTWGTASEFVGGALPYVLQSKLRFPGSAPIARFIGADAKASGVRRQLAETLPFEAVRASTAIGASMLGGGYELPLGLGVVQDRTLREAIVDEAARTTFNIGIEAAVGGALRNNAQRTSDAVAKKRAEFDALVKSKEYGRVLTEQEMEASFKQYLGTVQDTYNVNDAIKGWKPGISKAAILAEAYHNVIKPEIHLYTAGNVVDMPFDLIQKRRFYEQARREALAELPQEGDDGVRRFFNNKTLNTTLVDFMENEKPGGRGRLVDDSIKMFGFDTTDPIALGTGSNIIDRSPSNFEHMMQHPRMFTVTDLETEAADAVNKFREKLTTSGLTRVYGQRTGEGTLVQYMGRDLSLAGGNGLFVVARELQKEGSSEWLVFKTNQPGSFTPQKMVKDASYIDAAVRNVEENRARTLYNEFNVVPVNYDTGYFASLKQLDQELPFIAFDPGNKEFTNFLYSRIAAAAKTGKIEVLGMQFDYTPDMIQGSRQLAAKINDIKTAIRNNFQPSFTAMTNDPLASHVLMKSRVFSQQIHADMSTAIFGAPVVQDGVFGLSPTQLFKNIGHDADDKSLYAMLAKLHKKEPRRIGDAPTLYEKALRAMITSKPLAELQTESPILHDFMAKYYNLIDDVYEKSKLGTGFVQEATYLGLSREQMGMYATMTGSFRSPVLEQTQGNRVIFWAHGETAEDAQNMAAAIAERINKQTGTPVATVQSKGDKNRTVRSNFHQDVLLLKQIDNSTDSIYTTQKVQDIYADVLNDLINAGKYHTLEGKTAQEVSARLFQKLLHVALSSAEHSFMIHNDTALRMVQQADAYGKRENFKELNDRIATYFGHYDQATVQQNRAFNKVRNLFTTKAKGDDFALSEIVGKANAWAATTQLGFFNLAQGAMNISSIMTQVPALLAYIKTDPLHASSLFTYLPAIGADGLIRGTMKEVNIPKIMGGGFKLMAGKADAQLVKEFNEELLNAVKSGRLNARSVSDFAGDQSNYALMFQGKGGADNWLDGFLSAANFINAKTEEYSRIATFAIGFNFARRVGIAPTTARQFALDIVDHTMYQANLGNRAPVFKSPLGSAFGLFKNWSWTYMAMQHHYFDFALKNPGDIKRWKPILYSALSLFPVGGVAAMPFIPGMLDWASQNMNDEPFLYSLYNTFGDDPAARLIGDGIMYGLPALLGITFATNAAAPGHDLPSDLAMLATPYYYELAKQMVKVADAGLDANKFGQDPRMDAETQEAFFRAVLPKTGPISYRALQIAEDGAIDSLNNGYPLIDNPKVLGSNTAALVSYLTGVTPVDVQKVYDSADILIKNQDSKRQAIQVLGQQWAEAAMNRDYVALNSIYQVAAQRGLNVQSIMQSAQVRLSKFNQDLLSRAVKAEDSDKFRRTILGQTEAALDQVKTLPPLGTS